MPELPRQSNSAPRTELGRIAKELGLSLHEVPSPPGTAPWERPACCAGRLQHEITCPNHPSNRRRDA